MNGPIKQKLKVIPANVTWGGQSKKVFEALSADFMTSAISNGECAVSDNKVRGFSAVLYIHEFLYKDKMCSGFLFSVYTSDI